MEKINFLCHKITVHAIVPRREKVKVIENYLTPTTIADFSRFFGILNFYRRFLERTDGNFTTFQLSSKLATEEKRKNSGVVSHKAGLRQREEGPHRVRTSSPFRRLGRNVSRAMLLTLQLLVFCLHWRPLGFFPCTGPHKKSIALLVVNFWLSFLVSSTSGTFKRDVSSVFLLTIWPSQRP